MLLVQCPSCDHINPADAKVCSGCRLSLPDVSWHLAPCPRCGALNGVTATPCWSCNADLQIQTPGEVPSLPAARDSDVTTPPGLASEVGNSSAPRVRARTLSRQRVGLIIGSAVLATLAFSGYWVYRQRLSIVDPPSPAATPVRGIDRDVATAGNAKAGEAHDKVELSPVANSSSPVPPAAPAPTTPNNGRVDRGVVNSPEAASAAALKRQKATNAAARTGRQLPDIGPCTETIAALGLCVSVPAKSEE